jgi:Protein of unknown function with PCYCGC motif
MPEAVSFTRRVFALRAVGVIALVAAGCGGNDEPTTEAGSAGFASRFAKYKPAPEPNGDLDKVVWPDYVLQAPPEVKELYEFQVTHGEVMRYMPCFCGCGQNAGHRSNRDCYVQRVNTDGSVVFDSMAPT